MLRLVRTFGAYTQSIREAQQTGLIVHEQTLRILKDINCSQPSEQVNREKSA